MSLRGRVDRLARQAGADRPGPVTVVLREATAEVPPGRRERTNSAGLPVVEVVFDPSCGEVELPPAPYKLVAGVDPVDLV